MVETEDKGRERKFNERKKEGLHVQHLLKIKPNGKKIYTMAVNIFPSSTFFLKRIFSRLVNK